MKWDNIKLLLARKKEIERIKLATAALMGIICFIAGWAVCFEIGPLAALCGFAAGFACGMATSWLLDQIYQPEIDYINMELDKAGCSCAIWCSEYQ